MNVILSAFYALYSSFFLISSPTISTPEQTVSKTKARVEIVNGFPCLGYLYGDFYSLEGKFCAVTLSNGSILKIGKQIGGGGGGYVFEGDLEGKNVAVKLGHHSIGRIPGDAEELLALEKEGFQAIPQVKVYFDFQVPDRSYVSRIIVYEMLMPITYSENLFFKMIKNMNELHKHTTHNDIKPANLMQRSNGEPLFIDFDNKHGWAQTPFYQDHILAKRSGSKDYDRVMNDVIALGRSLLEVKHKELIEKEVHALLLEAPNKTSDFKTNLKKLNELFHQLKIEGDFWDYVRRIINNVDFEDEIMIQMSRGQFQDSDSVLRAYEKVEL